MTADAFMRKHHMHPGELSLDTFCRDFREEMSRGLRGERSSLGMFPAFLRCSARPRPGRVLVIDAGGTNLRLARLRYTEERRLVTEEVRRTRMPGTGGAINAGEMFEAIARELLPLLADCDRGCFCFSYPCEVLPGGDGRVVELTKELEVRGLPGSRLCSPLEEALLRLGAPGRRRWRVINDTVGAMLGGMAEDGGAGFDEYIGFVLGTGTNACAQVAAESIVKSPEAVAGGGEMIVNFESGGFDRITQGTADRLLDAASDSPGSQVAEKMISGAYFPALLRTTLRLAAGEGLLPGAEAWLEDADITMAAVGELCGEAGDGEFFAPLGRENRAFAAGVNELLLDRAAKITAGTLAAMIEARCLPGGSRVCVCADGTTFAKNPLLRPRTEDYLRDCLTAKSGVSVVFRQVSDATLLGTAYAGLLD